MSENSKSGCILWGFVGIISLVIVSLFTIDSSNSYTLAPIATVSAPPSSATVLVVKTFVPQNSNSYFEIENNQVSYGYFHTLGRPCYYVLSGHVLDLNKKPFTKFVVNIKTVSVEGVVPDSGYVFPHNGSFAEDGVSGWATLVSTLTDYEIWLTDKLNGMELSPHFRIPMRGCDQNRTIVNFIQIRALP